MVNLLVEINAFEISGSPFAAGNLERSLRKLTLRKKWKREKKTG
jgi:hypothetical protein